MSLKFKKIDSITITSLFEQFRAVKTDSVDAQILRKSAIIEQNLLDCLRYCVLAEPGLARIVSIKSAISIRCSIA